jgi:hypothetical protein
MTTDRAFRGVVRNFLSTYASRYSDYQGYWLFGFIVSSLSEFRVDLLTPAVPDPHTPSSALAAYLAHQKFTEQVQKARLDLSRLRGATLLLARKTPPVYGFVNGHRSAGHVIAFRATAVTETGRSYSAELEVFVAPHDPAIENRSASANATSEALPGNGAA